uniref:MARVEL domain-containing protein n=1 Tax=Odontella aurita TaxID=265563 RepID=A0A7S4I174_9STRA|mmetsp:Transcript_18467/g.53254  ORF Transcript_18467/g.53254 Transcript_18467/m.53254 type:complete len:146 (+) Transcript_18467:71-508(+)
MSPEAPIGDDFDKPIKVPLTLIRVIVVFDFSTIFLWFFGVFFPPLQYISLGCFVFATILACMLLCREADDEFQGRILFILISHVVTVFVYIAAVALQYAAVVRNGSDNWSSEELGMSALIMLFIAIVMVLFSACLSATFVRSIFQ